MVNQSLEEQSFEKIRNFIKENDYTYRIEDILTSYQQYWVKGYYTSWTMTHCIENLEEEIKTLIEYTKIKYERVKEMKNYSITKVVPKEKYYEVIIKADSNDADYITTTEKYSQEGFDEIVDELINLKHNYGGSHQLENYPNEFDFHIPYNGWDGYCHSLEELKITMYDEDGYVYDVTLGNPL